MSSLREMPNGTIFKRQGDHERQWVKVKNAPDGLILCREIPDPQIWVMVNTVEIIPVVLEGDVLHQPVDE